MSRRRPASIEGVTPEPDLLLRHQRHGHGFERRSDDGRHLHGAGQFRRQHGLHQRHASTTFTISEASAHRERDRRQRDLQRRGVPGHDTIQREP